MFFPSPQETAKNLAEAIDFARRGEVEVARLKPVTGNGVP